MAPTFLEAPAFASSSSAFSWLHGCQVLCLVPFGPSLFNFLHLLCVVGVFITSLLQTRKLRPREAMKLAQIALDAGETWL